MHLRLAAALAALACGSAAAAFIPPSISVKVVSGDRNAEATSRAIVELLAAHDNFQWAGSALSRPAALACAAKHDLCLRAVVRGRPVERQAPPALIVARPAGEGQVAWTCIGAGERPARAADQAVTLDVATLFAGKAEARRAAQRQALACIRAAAAEAGGIISVD